MIDEYYTWLIYGYHSDDLKPRSRKCVVAVCDECYVYRTSRLQDYHDMCIKCAAKFRELIQKYPLSDGWKSKLGDITKNKECSVYLGSIAEVILSNIYDNVQVMPYGNHGYDVICNRDFKIDIKSCATGDKGHWNFHIRQNQIADYFLCLAFESRDDLNNPVHLWMIPGHIINHLSQATISKSTLDKWQQYELSLDKLLMCCNSRRA